MRSIFLCMATIGLMVVMTGCGTIQHADRVVQDTRQVKLITAAFVAKSKNDSNDAVRLEAVRGASTTTVRQPGGATAAPCPDLDKQEDEFKELCDDHTEGSGDINIDREAVCVPLRAALDQLRTKCPTGDQDEQTEVIFAPSEPPTAGVHINLTGASTGDIRLIIQSPGAADQSTNGAPDAPSTPAPPQSVIAGMSNGLLEFLGKATPWVAGGYALGNVADAFADGLRNAGDRDNSVDQSVSTDNSIGGDKIDMPAVE
jgi:hypothetical protein